MTSDIDQGVFQRQSSAKIPGAGIPQVSGAIPGTVEVTLFPYVLPGSRRTY